MDVTKDEPYITDIPFSQRMTLSQIWEELEKRYRLVVYEKNKSGGIKNRLKN